LFQLRIAPEGGSTAWAWPAKGTYPRQSNSPVPTVGSAGSVSGARTGSRPLEKNAMSRSSA
jgi:hypothetical protein